jgi:hypothetical protein
LVYLLTVLFAEQVALKRFIDDIAIEVIEAKLISLLHDIFSPITTAAMPADLVTHIAGESEEDRAQREQWTRQLDILTKGSETCKRFIGVRALGEKITQLVFSEPLLNSYAGTEGGMIKGGTWLKSANQGLSDYDEGSEEDFDDLNYLSDIPIVEECKLSTKEIARNNQKSRSSPQPPPSLMEIPQDDPTLLQDAECSFNPKKKGKKEKKSVSRCHDIAYE